MKTSRTKVASCLYRGFNHLCLLISPIVALDLGLGSKQSRIRLRADLDKLGESVSTIRPLIASLMLGNGDAPVRRYDSRTPSVHTSAGAAWYGFLRRISDEAYAVVP